MIAASAARGARQDAAKQFSALLSEADRHAKRMRAFELGLALCLSPEASSITFCEGSQGSGFLEQGWTDPNEIAPWSLPPFAEIALPSGCGWERADAIRVTGYLFCPHQMPVNGHRRMVVWVNGAKVWDEVISNEVSGDTAVVEATLKLPDHVRALGGRLVLRIVTADIPTQNKLGLSSDDRPIGFAPLNLTFLFDGQVPK